MKLDPRTKYTPEMIAKWSKELANGTIDKEGIMAKTGISRDELNKKLRNYKN